MLLLADLHRIFASESGKLLMEENNKPALKTQQLLDSLIRLDESPWKTFRRDGSRLNSRDMSQLLKPYGIKSSNIWWTKEKNGKGYYLSAFEDAWSRYVKEPEPEVQPPTTANGSHFADESILKSTEGVS